MTPATRDAAASDGGRAVIKRWIISDDRPGTPSIIQIGSEQDSLFTPQAFDIACLPLDVRRISSILDHLSFDRRQTATMTLFGDDFA